MLAIEGAETHETVGSSPPSMLTYREALARYHLLPGGSWGTGEQVSEQIGRAMAAGRLRVVQTLLDDRDARETLAGRGLLGLVAAAVRWRAEAERHESANGPFSRLDLSDEFNARMLPYWLGDHRKS